MGQQSKAILFSFLLIMLSLGQAVAQPQLYKVLRYDGANLYEKASFSSIVVKHLSYGQHVEVLARYDDWAYARTGDKEGFIYLRYFTQVRPRHGEAYSSRTARPQNHYAYYASPSPSPKVYICLSPNAYAYHSNPNCKGLSRCRHTIVKVSEQEARRRGYRRCRICYTYY